MIAKVTGVATLRSSSGSRPRRSSEARIPRARRSQWGHRRWGADIGWEVGGKRDDGDMDGLDLINEDLKVLVEYIPYLYATLDHPLTGLVV